MPYSGSFSNLPKKSVDEFYALPKYNLADLKLDSKNNKNDDQDNLDPEMDQELCGYEFNP